MAKDSLSEKFEQRLEWLEVLEYHAWECYGELKDTRERLAALKVVADLVLSQLKLTKELLPRKEIVSVEYYEEEVGRFRERVGLLAERRRGGRPPVRA